MEAMYMPKVIGALPQNVATSKLKAKDVHNYGLYLIYVYVNYFDKDL
jgi:hypothetical protein